jgi:hypothetical protein
MYDLSYLSKKIETNQARELPIILKIRRTPDWAKKKNKYNSGQVDWDINTHRNTNSQKEKKH